MKAHLIFLHGLFEHDFFMKPLAKKLSNLGYSNTCIDYKSTSINLNVLFSDIDNAVLNSNGLPVYFVGHSLGGVMIRTYFDIRGPVANSKVVTLGSPHKTSELAKWVKELGLGGFMGNAKDYGLINQACHSNWCHMHTPLGSIAGNKKIGLMQFNSIFRSKENDGYVLVEETMVDGMSDHVVLPLCHTSLLYSELSAIHIDNFFTNNRFN